jgi:hypothetical protein
MAQSRAAGRAESAPAACAGCELFMSLASYKQRPATARALRGPEACRANRCAHKTARDAHLRHEFGDHAVEEGALEVQGLAGLADALLTGAPMGVKSADSACTRALRTRA